MSRAFEKPLRGVLKSGVMGGKSLRMALRGPNKTRQRGAACTNIGSMKAASIMAEDHRPVITSHIRKPSARAAKGTSAQRPPLRMVRGSAWRVQAPILTADTNRESPRVVGQDSQVHRALSSRV